MGCALLSVASTPIHAQLAWTFHSATEFDSRDAVLAHAGIAYAPRRTGWVSSAGIQASWLKSPLGAGTEKLVAATPVLGIQHRSATAVLALHAGYNITNNALSDDAVFAVAVGEGVVNIVQLDYLGRGALGAQAMAGYNYGSENVWSTARLDHRVLTRGESGQLRMGAELAYLNNDSFSAIQPGIIVEFRPSLTARLGLGLGRRFIDLGDATYFKAAIALTR
jgi:hypothetical protein